MLLNNHTALCLFHIDTLLQLHCCCNHTAATMLLCAAAAATFAGGQVTPKNTENGQEWC